MSTVLPSSLQARLLADDLLTRYCVVLDQGRLEEWCNLFAENASYQVLSRENVDLNLPGAILLLETKEAMLDRVAALRETAVYNIHYSRRFISALQAGIDERGRIRFTANVAVHQTDQDGHSKLFVVGQLDGVLSPEVNSRCLIERLVVTIDTFAVPTLLAVPI